MMMNGASISSADARDCSDVPHLLEATGVDATDSRSRHLTTNGKPSPVRDMQKRVENPDQEMAFQMGTAVLGLAARNQEASELPVSGIHSVGPRIFEGVLLVEAALGQIEPPKLSNTEPSSGSVNVAKTGSVKVVLNWLAIRGPRLGIRPARLCSCMYTGFSAPRVNGEFEGLV
ncbi:MAG: hypothetical protein Q9188_004741 [Gyalolechia gomerana]